MRPERIDYFAAYVAGIPLASLGGEISPQATPEEPAKPAKPPSVALSIPANAPPEEPAKPAKPTEELPKVPPLRIFQPSTNPNDPTTEAFARAITAEEYAAVMAHHREVQAARRPKGR
jgi:hypothetical protein